MVYHILVGSYSNEIYTLAFHPDACSLMLLSSLTVGHHPSWIERHPSNPSVILAGIEQADGQVVAVEYDKQWRGKVVCRTTSGGADPCTILPMKDELLIGNYSTGNVTAIPLVSKTPYIQETTTVVQQFKGQGPDTTRQTASHPHQVAWIPSLGELLVPDLGADQVHRLAKNGGKWVVTDNIPLKAGGGPRHVAFYNGVLYTLMELTSEVAAHYLPPLPTAPAFITSVSTLSVPLPLPDMLAAEILIPTPNSQFPTPYLYVSNRNDPSPDGDTIAIFDISHPEKLTLVAEVRTGLRHLRGMVFGGPDDRWLVAGGAHGPGVKIFERTNGGRMLKEIASVEVAAPTGFLWV
ncbi:putative isomerase YbhE, partial [Obba rivulosa]